MSSEHDNEIGLRNETKNKQYKYTLNRRLTSFPIGLHDGVSKKYNSKPTIEFQS